MLICKAKHLLYQSIYLLQKMGESTSKFDFERIVPVFFARTVPFGFLRESSILCTFSYLNHRTLPPFSCVLGVKCGVHLCCNTCCEHVQLISIELPLLCNYARNGQIYCNLIPRIPGVLQYKTNDKMHFCKFFIKIQ